MDSDSEASGPFPIYLPRVRSGVLADVLPGSAIVGFPLETDNSTIHVYYEGNRYESDDLRRFADRAKIAAGRCRWFRLNVEEWEREHGSTRAPATEFGYAGYPTSAQALIPTLALTKVALYDDVLGIVTPIGLEQAAMLDAWIGGGDPLEYFATGAAFERRRAAAGVTDSDEPRPPDTAPD